MKIAIITLPLHTNYGGILQAYALQTTLKRLGHTVTLLEPERFKHPPIKMFLIYFRRAYYKYVLRQDIEIFTSPLQKIRKHIDDFIKERLDIKYIKEWGKYLTKEYDSFVVGSDQIWRPKYCYSLGHAYLDFTQGCDTVRIAYATSFGTSDNEYTTEQQELCRPLAQQFDCISTREDSGIALCKELFGIQSIQMPDPTLLLTKDDYIKIIRDSTVSQSKGSLLVYILDENQETKQHIQDMIQRKALIPFKINSPIDGNVLPPVEHWLRGFQDAEFVITDSFHACVFSILFHKPFICIGNKDRGMSRFTSLLKMFHLEDRLVSSLEDFTDTPINWEEVDAILATKRAEAMEFLTTALNPMG